MSKPPKSFSDPTPTPKSFKMTPNGKQKISQNRLCQSIRGTSYPKIWSIGLKRTESELPKAKNQMGDKKILQTKSYQSM